MPHFRLSAYSSAAEKTASAAKIRGACRKVFEYFLDEFPLFDELPMSTELPYLWMDTICIDKKNSTELSMSINSMYRWYEQARCCFVYLEDYPTKDVPVFTRSKWFTRGWTLQELAAPRYVIFFDKHWNSIGDRASLHPQLTSRTKISRDFLSDSCSLNVASISHRMSWMSGRETSVPEDTAYCLLDLFGVNMPLLYGEGKERAFRRLQEEIMKYSDDHTLFAWKDANSSITTITGLLASTQDCFEMTGGYIHDWGLFNNAPYQMTNKGISIELYIQQHKGMRIASIDCLDGEDHCLGIYLYLFMGNDQQFRRVRANEMCKVPRKDRGRLKRIFVK
ncbi:MAG: hypothetical protein Q9223_007459 [Gallowayella weberi]